MRAVWPLLFAVSISACSTERIAAPREYLDEHTAATITVVKDPWIFTRTAAHAGSGQYRDFLHLYAVDVNRMGDHKQYIAALHSTASDSASGSDAPVTLELRTRNGTMTLHASTSEPKEFGIAQPIAPSYALDATWSYFPVDKHALATIANTTEMEAAIVWQGEKTDYAQWRDGRDELSELTAVLP